MSSLGHACSEPSFGWNSGFEVQEALRRLPNKLSLPKIEGKMISAPQRLHRARAAGKPDFPQLNKGRQARTTEVNSSWDSTTSFQNTHVEGSKDQVSQATSHERKPAWDEPAKWGGDSYAVNVSKETVVTRSYPFRTKSGLTNRVTSAVSVMDDRYCESLQRHYRLLMTHITLTDDVIEQMSTEKILPETMIKDIQNADTREERNERLLNSLRLRGNKSYKRFRELMYRTGNFFVADLLWEEGDGPGIIEEKDLSKFPGLLNSVQDQNKKKLMRYLDSKIREKALLLAWKTSPVDRMEALKNKVVDFNQEKLYRDTISQQEEKIKTLESALQTEQEMANSMHVELSSLQQQIVQIKREHRSSMDTQTRFHDANLSTIVRLKDRLSKVNTTLSDLTDSVRHRVELAADESSDSTNNVEDENQKMVMLERNIRRLLTQLRKEQDETSAFNQQREDVLKLLNRRYSKDPLVTIIKDVLKHEQKHRSIVMRDILKLAEALKQVMPSTTPGRSSAAPAVAVATTPSDPSTLDTKHFKSQLAMMKAEVQHIQKRFAWKDSEIEALRTEIVQLKNGMGPVAFSPGISTSTLSVSNPDNPPVSPGSVPLSPASVSSQPSKSVGPLSVRQTVKKFPEVRRGGGSGGKTVTFVETVRRVVANGRSVRRSGEMPPPTPSSFQGDSDKMLINIDQYLEEEDEDKDDGGGDGDLLLSLGVRPGSAGEGDANSALAFSRRATNQR